MKASLIEVRCLRFHLPKALAKHWNDNCPVKTHLFNSIAILAPAFERLAISSVLPFKSTIQDSLLHAQVQGFIGQESAHGSEFIRYNRVLDYQGYDTKKLERDNLKKFKWVANKFSPLMHLSLTLAAEHLTAIISDLVLREKNWLQNAEPACRALWRWHAIEEIEHKAVVYDLYCALKGNYLRRIGGMLLVSLVIGGLLASNFMHLIWRDKLFFKLSFWGRWLSICWGKQGFLRKLMLPYLRYYLPFFHPWQQKNSDLIRYWQQQFVTMASPDEMIQSLQR